LLSVNHIQSKLNRVAVRGRPFLTFRRILELFWLTQLKPRLDLDPNMREGLASDVKFDVVIPVAEKDLETLPYAVEGVRKNLMHPIGEIIIVGQKKPRLVQTVEKLHCRFVDEAALLADLPEFSYELNGVDRSGWLRQQFIKLSFDAISTSEHVLILDADTVFIRPHVMLWKGRTVFNQSSDYHRPYFEVLERILGINHPSALSFTAHYVPLSRTIITALKRELETKNGCSWYQAILEAVDLEEGAAFSEQDLYGNYFFVHHRREMSRNYWFNLALSREELSRLDFHCSDKKNRYKSISFHNYMS
jgi:hypothetical protein